MRTAKVRYTKPNSLLCFVPDLLPDECLYSFLQRIWSLNAFTSPRQFMFFLFGSESHIPALDLPTGLDALQYTLGVHSPFKSTADLIDRATLYPYHRPFLSVMRNARLIGLFQGTGGKGVKTLLGRVANGFGAQAIARYCILCNMRALEQYGCTYWQRSHQLPGVAYCVAHRTGLQTFADLSQLTHRQQLQQSPWTTRFTSTPISFESHAYQLSLISVALLKANLYIDDVRALHSVYIFRILSMGFRTTRGKVDFTALTAAVRIHYDDFHGFEHRERLLSSPRYPLYWLYSTLKRPERASHPICHLLLIRFLFGSLEKFVEAFKSDANGMVENRQSQDKDNSSQLPITNTGASIHKSSAREPECQAALSLKYQSAIIELRAGLPIANISKKLGISIRVIYRVRANTPGLKQAHADRRTEIEREERRKHWITLCQKRPMEGIALMRTTAPATYAWLRRNDTHWFKDVCATLPRAASRRNGRVDWAKRDNDLAAQARKFVAEERRRINRSRISHTRILRYLNREAMVRANYQRLPVLHRTLIELSESTEEFQMFRIDVAIDKLVHSGLFPSCWRLQRLARLKKWTPSLMSYAISRGLEKS